jgi:LysM repeat protein
MSHLNPEEVERIKEEQRLRTRETVKTGFKMYWEFVWKILKISCGCVLVIIVVGGLIALIASGIAGINQRKQARVYAATSTARSVEWTATAQVKSKQSAQTLSEPTKENMATPAPERLPTNTNTPEVQPSPTPLPTATQIPSGPWIYPVKSEHETPACLARRFNVDLNNLLAMNLLSNDSKFSTGLDILIPAGSAGGFQGERTLKIHPDTYIVQPGDSIYSIACAYGDVFPEDILVTNGLSEPYTLEAGQKLLIP